MSHCPACQGVLRDGVCRTAFCVSFGQEPREAHASRLALAASRQAQLGARAASLRSRLDATSRRS